MVTNMGVFVLAVTARTWPLVLEALAVSGAVGAAALALRTVGRSGFIAGVTAGTVVYLAVGRVGFALLALFFVAGSVLTRVGFARKRALGAAQERRGARSAANVIGKGLVPVACAVLAWHLEGPPWAQVAYTAALAAALADTAGTELGPLLGRRFWTLPRFRRVPAGTPGAISAEGTIAGLVAAAAFGAVAAVAGFVPYAATALVAAVAVAAGLWESAASRLVGNSLPGHLRGPLLNIALTALAAGAAGVLWYLLARG